MKQPRHFHDLRRRYPDYFEALDRLGETARQLGPLDSRNCHLLQLAAAAAKGSQGAVHSHARRALEGGATPEELQHALLILTSTIGFPAVSAALSWVDDLQDSEGPSGTPRV